MFTRREWVSVVVAAAILALVLWGQWSGQRQAMASDEMTRQALERISQQLDAKEQARIDMLEARIIALEKTQARLRARTEGEE